MAHIFENGLCCKRHELADTNYTPIGHGQLIQDRDSYTIPIDGKGNLGDYIPFYFAGHTPMLYMIKEGIPPVNKFTQDDIVFVVFSIQSVLDHKCEYLITDRNAKLSLANYYQSVDDLDKLNWDAIRDKNWGFRDREPLTKDLKQAEFLVYHHLPIEAIFGIAVNKEAQKTALDLLAKEKGVHILIKVDNHRKLYF